MRKPADPAVRRIVFSHANGFPAGSYRVLFEAWRAAGFEVHAVPKFGHDPRFPEINKNRRWFVGRNCRGGTP